MYCYNYQKIKFIYSYNNNNNNFYLFRDYKSYKYLKNKIQKKNVFFFSYTTKNISVNQNFFTY